MGPRPPDVLGESAIVTDPPPAHILLVDDHQVVRSGLKTLIDFESDLVVSGEAETAAQAIERVESNRPDLVVMDVRLPDRSGISACLEITTRFPGVKVMILTSHADTVAVSSAIPANPLDTCSRTSERPMWWRT